VCVCVCVFARTQFGVYEALKRQLKRRSKDDVQGAEKVSLIDYSKKWKGHVSLMQTSWRTQERVTSH